MASNCVRKSKAWRHGTNDGERLERSGWGQFRAMRNFALREREMSRGPAKLSMLAFGVAGAGRSGAATGLNSALTWNPSKQI
jgi:hypothetical protein